jgi:hypothetical protein
MNALQHSNSSTDVFLADHMSFSPRGDYRAPSDSDAAIWFNQVELIPDEVKSG